MPPKKTNSKKTTGKKTPAKKTVAKKTVTKKPAKKNVAKKRPVVATTTPAVASKSKTTVSKKSCCSSVGLKIVLFLALVLLGISSAVNINYYQKENADKSANTDFDKEQERIVVDGNVWQNLGLLVEVKIVTDSTCETCADLTTEPMKQTIQGAFPFGEVVVIDVAKEEAPAGVVGVPTIVIDNKLEESKIFPQIKPYLTKIEGGYEMPPASLNIRSNTKVIDKSILPSADGEEGLVIFEYSEFACPYCKRFATETWPVLSEKYGDQIKLDFRHFIVHPSAAPGSVASECARKLGGDEKFEEMHDVLFRDQKFDEESILAYGEELGLNTEEYTTCLNDPEIMELVSKTSQEAKSLTIVGTPSFLIGDTIYRGALPAEQFEEIIDKKLNQ